MSYLYAWATGSTSAQSSTEPPASPQLDPPLQIPAAAYLSQDAFAQWLQGVIKAEVDKRVRSLEERVEALGSPSLPLKDSSEDPSAFPNSGSQCGFERLMHLYSDEIERRTVTYEDAQFIAEKVSGIFTVLGSSKPQFEQQGMRFYFTDDGGICIESNGLSRRLWRKLAGPPGSDISILPECFGKLVARFYNSTLKASNLDLRQVEILSYHAARGSLEVLHQTHYLIQADQKKKDAIPNFFKMMDPIFGEKGYLPKLIEPKELIAKATEMLARCKKKVESLGQPTMIGYLSYLLEASFGADIKKCDHALKDLTVMKDYHPSFVLACLLWLDGDHFVASSLQEYLNIVHGREAGSIERLRSQIEALIEEVKRAREERKVERQKRFESSRPDTMVEKGSKLIGQALGKA